MQLALAAPLFRSVVLGGIVFGLTVAAVRPNTQHVTTHRLVLHTTCRPHAIYLTAWRHGTLLEAIDDHDALPPLVFKAQARAYGCDWLATETLTPIAKDRYAYSYDEQILRCDPDALGGVTTPRTGIVTVE